MISKVVKYSFDVWILFTNHTCFGTLKGEKTSYKTAFLSCIESDSCIIVSLKVLSKASKGRYLDFKRASFASQKGVNWKPIYALFVCRLRILFTKPLVLTKAIENLKGRSMWKSIVLLLLCLHPILLLGLGLCCLLFSLLTSNLLARYLVNKRNVLLLLCLYIPLFLCFSVTLSLFYPVFVLLLPCLNLTLSQSALVILSTTIVVIIIMNFELWIRTNGVMDIW